jgi:hypothetical protein
MFDRLPTCSSCLGDAMTAHALTNFPLGLWVVWKGAWSFW